MKANSSASWASYASILYNGEIGYDYEKGYFRIGNGSYAWSSMPYGFYPQPNLTNNINKFLQVTGSVGSETLSWSAPSYSQLADNPNALTIDQAAGIAATNLTVGNVAQTAYTFNSHYSGNNPTISVTGGTTIAFNLGAAGHPFQIQSNGGSGSTYTNITTGLTWVGTNGAVQSGALAQAQMSGTLYWNVPASVTAGTLYKYQCASHTVMNGVITWVAPTTPTYIPPRTTTVTDTATPAPSANTDDFYVITGLTQTATFAAPAGTPVNGQSLKIRIKDNGTARTLAWNAIYRASSDLALPTTTVSNKTMYIGFIYNSTDSKWDFVASLGNF
jgi:hypothetical protein